MMCNAYVVEDDDAVRASLTSLLLARGGLAVRAFACADAFLAAADELEPGVLLLDLHMPGMGGIDLIDALGTRLTRFPAIVLTGDGDVMLAIRAMNAGVRDFIEKPHDSHTLLRAVDEACRQLLGEPRQGAPDAEVQARVARLTLRERQVLHALAKGHGSRAIADELGVSPRAVELDRVRVIEKLGARNLAQALVIAHGAGLLHLDA